MTHPIHVRPTPWNTIILMCGKCSRKLKGGYGPKGDATLRMALKRELQDQGYRRGVRIAETKCFGVCPKKAVVTLNATSPGRLLTIPRGTDAGEALRAIFDGSEVEQST